MVYASFKSFRKTQSYLEENAVKIISSGFDCISQVTKIVTVEQIEDIEKLIEKLDYDDAQNVYHTMKEAPE